MPSEDLETQRTIDTAIRIGIVALIVFACFQILSPFLLAVVWAVIIAVAVSPLLRLLAGKVGDKAALALFALLGLALLIVPAVMLSGSAVEAVGTLNDAHEAGTLHVPPPPPEVAELPVIGERLHRSWSEAANNLSAALVRHKDEVARVIGVLLASAASAGGTILQFIVSILIATAFLAQPEGGERVARAIARRIAGDSGEEFVDLSIATTRSVAQGVLGVALIQAILAGIGMLAVGVPASGVWAVLVLVLAIVQLPPLVVLGPVMIYVFSANDTVPAVIFMIYGLVVSASDTFLKPLFLGRGLDIPMLVILLGAIGGMLLWGVLGLFVGAVVLALAYSILVAWLEQTPEGESLPAAE